MTTMYGPAGAEWVKRLPGLLAQCEQRWQIQIQPPFALTYNYVAPAKRAGGSQVVLKAGFPENPELITEIEALRFFDGQGMVHLLEADLEQGVFLLEHIFPGHPLVNLPDDDATRIAARVMRRLWKPIPPELAARFPSTQKWARGLGRLRKTFGGGTGPFPADMVERAEKLFVELHASAASAPVLLHGDLHHWNILSAQREPWLALDPKGLVGEPAYEVGALIRNPNTVISTWTDLARVQARRFDILAEELGFNRQRMIFWSFAQVVLSAWWSFEDEHRYVTGWLPVAMSLQQLMTPKN